MRLIGVELLLGLHLNISSTIGLLRQYKLASGQNLFQESMFKSIYISERSLFHKTAPVCLGSPTTAILGDLVRVGAYPCFNNFGAKIPKTG